jgi:hypothetical protein
MTMIVLLICSVTPMICVIVWQVKRALEGGYYYTNKEDIQGGETT